VGFGIKETFRVDAPVDRVWRYLVDPTQVVGCLPGAELTGDEGERVYLGKVKVKVGPVTASYAGRARLTEVNEAEHVVRMDAEGRESGGAGSAKLRMLSRVASHADGGSEVRVEAEVDVAGKIVQFGRGMIEAVSKQLFREFVTCVRARLEAPSATARVGSAPKATAPAPADAGRAALPAVADNTRTQMPAPPAPPASTGAGTAASPVAKPVAVLPLVLRALWATLTGWLARVLGRRRPA
jgi:carbon monoxide dehydrogenase subunit G